MIDSFSKLKEYLDCDSKNYTSQVHNFWGGFKANLFANPISDQKYIWKYIKTLRYVEFFDLYRKKNSLYFLLYVIYLKRLRHYSRITSYQIPPHTCGKGLTIWHWGSIIINPAAKIGDNCTLYPGVLIGHKSINGGGSNYW